MQFVVDASVSLAWFLGDETTPRSEELFDQAADGQAVAPAVWVYEMLNGFVSARRRGRMTADEAFGHLADLRDLPVEVSGFTSLRSVLETAFRYELTAYDAAYLDLASGRDLPLATRDDRLRAAAEAAGIEVLAA